MEVFKLLSSALHQYYLKRGDQTAYELYQLLVGKDVIESFRWLKRYDERRIFSIDPIALFSAINDRRITKELRIQRINLLFEKLDFNYKIADLDITGCPTPVALKMTTARTIGSQLEIWGLFDSIISKGQAGLSEDYWNLFKSWYGVELASFTIFLFWINPQNFIPLDKNTVGYLKTKNYTSSTIKNYDQYISILNQTDHEDYVEFAKQAYIEQQKTDEINFSDFGIVNSDLTIKSRSENDPGNANQVFHFKLLGFKICDGMHDDHKRMLEVGKPYQFYSAYDFSDENKVTYDRNKELDLYSLNNLQVSISAIVGKNGMGKSTVTELLHIASNNLAALHPDIATDLEVVQQFSLNLYYLTEQLFCLEFRGGKANSLLTIKKYKTAPNKSYFSNPEIINISEFGLQDFFYCISINYSLYALNTKRFGEWLGKLFHKNDSYQTPIVINPQRKHGNIDVNLEHSLAESRLLANILSVPIEEGSLRNTLIQLTEKKKAISIELNSNISKTTILFTETEKRDSKNPNDEPRTVDHKFSKAKTYWTDFLLKLQKVFEITLSIDAISDENPDFISSFDEMACRYILRKLINIARTYDEYFEEFDVKRNEFADLEAFLVRIKNDNSHITYKIKQAINFIRYPYLQNFFADEIEEEKIEIQAKRIPINALAEAIKTVKDDAHEKGQIDLEIIHLIPPSFFDPTILLEDNIPLTKLSSGERQQIYTVSTLAYHLFNLNSKFDDGEAISYRFVQVYFDEVELYFHPDMQRKFIDHLFRYLKCIDLDNITAVNFIFITHSPFILSDIPDSSVLFLGDFKPVLNTFGANIHDLLSDGFFLKDGFMGAYAQKVINKIANYLNTDNDSMNEDDNDTDWNSSNKGKDVLLKIIASIGEPLIRDRLKDMYMKKFGKEMRLQMLLEEVKKLESEINQ